MDSSVQMFDIPATDDFKIRFRIGSELPMLVGGHAGQEYYLIASMVLALLCNLVIDHCFILKSFINSF